MEIIEFLKLQPFGFNETASVLGKVFGVADFLIYNIAVYAVFGLLKSISISYLSVRPKWLFQAFMWCAIVCILLITQNIIYLIVCLFFVLTTVNPTIDKGKKYFIPHMIGAIGAITLGLIALPLCYGLDLIVFTLCALVGTIMIFVLSHYNKELDKYKIILIEWITISQLLGGLLFV